MNISIIGTGYVGLITGAGLAEKGHQVTCVDISKEKVKLINERTPPIYEKGLKELLVKVVPSKLKATTNFKAAVLNSDATFICVGTPSRKRGSINLDQIKKASQEIGIALKRKKGKHYIIVKSTVVPGTMQETVIPQIEKHSGKKYPNGFGAVSCPEFLREGSALEDFRNPDRIVIGSNDNDSIKAAEEIFKKFEAPIIRTSFKEAEMIKYASNAFLATKLSFINEIGNICKKMSINTNKVAEAVGLDHRIGRKFFKSGIGFGGSCFPKDVQALIYKATEHGYHPRLLRSVLDVNRDQPIKLLELLDENDKFNNDKIAILGLTFKAGTDDIRESPSLSIIKELLLDDKELIIFDPVAVNKVKKLFPHLKYASSAQEAVDSADVALILTEWPEFKDVDYKEKLVIDGKNIFDGKRPKNYQGVCW
ncbi:UDP-glucose/GDP-mannose dehydrogenase family protein [Candidatus Woesearchaeota archaeon]|nr:MAG: UDP-glucose/GDP-mannose dehydrogenase family protein [Candidatus Woesearchaeota archaeon]